MEEKKIVVVGRSLSLHDMSYGSLFVNLMVQMIETSPRRQFTSPCQ